MTNSEISEIKATIHENAMHIRLTLASINVYPADIDPMIEAYMKSAMTRFGILPGSNPAKGI